MNGISCFGNFSMGELGSLKNLNLNANKFLSSFSFPKLGADRCTIPGFTPPNLPSIAIPPFPIFGGIPAFDLFCGLPPFPGIPALSLPAIGIPLPPIPFLPPIPLPIIGFSLPKLPTLPKFDLGSLNFLCGLIKIKLPILDPFAQLNSLIGRLNAFIDALSKFLNFCKANAETINTTQSPPVVEASLAPAAPLKDPEPKSQKTSGGISVPNLTNSGQKTVAKTKTKQKSPKVKLKDITAISTELASNLALYLANLGVFPPEASLINKVAGLFAPYGTIGELTEEEITKILEENNIPSNEDYIGFKSIDLEDSLATINGTSSSTNTNGSTSGPTSANLNELLNNLTKKGLLGDNTSIKSAAYQALSGIDLNSTSGIELAIALNSNGIPYGSVPTNLYRITAEDIARAFYLQATVLPLSAKGITNTLKKVGVIEDTKTNLEKSLASLLVLPAIITPASLEKALFDVNAGPSAGSLKAMCIARTEGINPQSLVEIELARADTLLQSVSTFQNTTFLKVLQGTSLQKFTQLMSQFDIPFPSSLYEIIPLLAIAFDVDDYVLIELFANFKTNSIIENIGQLFNFLAFVVESISSQQAALSAIKNCKEVKEDGFSFRQFSNSIQVTLSKYSIKLPSSEEINKQIANALRIEYSYDYFNVLKILQDTIILSIDQLAFLLLASGIVISTSNKQLQLKIEKFISTDSQVLQNPISITLSSPTKLVGDIDALSITITLTTSKSEFGSIKEIKRVVLQDGLSYSGSTVFVTVNDYSQTIEIVIIKVDGFDISQESITKIEVEAYYKTLMSTSAQLIPNYLISIKV